MKDVNNVVLSLKSQLQSCVNTMILIKKKKYENEKTTNNNLFLLLCYQTLLCSCVSTHLMLS